MSDKNFKKVLTIFSVLLLLPNVAWANSGDMWKIVLYPLGSIIIEGLLIVINLYLLWSYFEAKKTNRRKNDLKEKLKSEANENNVDVAQQNQKTISVSVLIIFTILHLIILAFIGEWVFILVRFIWNGLIYIFGLLFLGQH